MKYIKFFIFLFCQLLMSQNDFTSDWKDLYSYNGVKDFFLRDNKLIAISENAMFITDLDTDVSEKISSVNGLSGVKTSSLGYDEISGYTLIGYENGLIEMISDEGDVLHITGARDNFILVDKEVKGFVIEQDYKYAYGSFGIVELNIERAEHINWYKLSNNSVPATVNKALVLNNILYVATSNGLYSIDLTLGVSLETFTNWTQVKTGTITDLIILSNEVYFTQGNSVFNIIEPNTALINTISNVENISLNDTNDSFVITMSSLVQLYDVNLFTLMDEIDLNNAIDYDFTTEKAIVNKGTLYVQTDEFGVLKTNIIERNHEYTEYHPDGPSANDAFSITAKNNDVWMSYGGYTNNSNFSSKTRGVSGFYNDEWYNIPHSKLNVRDITKIEIHPDDASKIYIASYLNGIVVAEFQQNDNTGTGEWNKVDLWTPTSTNGGIKESAVSSFKNGIISYLSFDNNQNLWVSSIFSQDNEFMSRYNFDTETWETRVNFSEVFGLSVFDDKRILSSFINSDGDVFCRTNRNGLVFFKESHDEELDENNSNNLIGIFNTGTSNGALPSNNVKSVITDENNRIWIGTDLGLVVFDDYDNLYSSSKRDAYTLIFDDEDGVAKPLLGSTQVNDMIIDLSGNKWFGTEGAGLIHTSSDGQTTFNQFKTNNSPLPSNTILDLELDEITGEIYIVTENGVILYDGKNEPFGSNITSIVAYPNPAIRSQVGHETITIVAKDGNGIPDNTNVKIMDVSGKLVYETNVGGSNDAIGGKIIWDKKNLSGNYVVSGVYIVLLSSQDASETTTTKIAIIN